MGEHIMKSIYNEPLFSNEFIDHIVKTDKKIITESKLYSIKELLAMIISNELLNIGLKQDVISWYNLHEIDFQKIIEKTGVVKSRRILVFSYMGNFCVAGSYFRNRKYYPRGSLVIQIDDILFELYSNLGLSYINKRPLLHALSDEEFYKYYPKDKYSEEEIKAIKEGIRMLTKAFFDTLQ